MIIKKILNILQIILNLYLISITYAVSSIKMTRKKILLVSSLVIISFIVFFTTLSYAKAAYSNVGISASIPPHYEVKTINDILYVTTNMKMIINGKEVDP